MEPVTGTGSAGVPSQAAWRGKGYQVCTESKGDPKTRTFIATESKLYWQEAQLAQEIVSSSCLPPTPPLHACQFPSLQAAHFTSCSLGCPDASQACLYSRTLAHPLLSAPHSFPVPTDSSPFLIVFYFFINFIYSLYNSISALPLHPVPPHSSAPHLP